jgi:LysR family hydrogen peroxide-inducible transcriptional activator
MGSALRKVLERAAAAADISLRAQAEIDGARLLASLALDGFGAAVVPATAVPNWLTGAFRMISVPELPRRVVAFVRRRRPGPNAPTQATLEVLQALISERGHLQPGVHPGTSAIGPLRTD